MKNAKRLLAIVLSMAMLICVLPMGALTVSAASNPYGKYQTISGVTTVRCTWYAWEQAYNNTGAIMPNFGNAKNWYSSAQSNGFSVGSTPKANSIAVWTNSGYGHVGYVVSVNGSKITVNEGGMLDTNGNAYNGTGIINGSVCNSTVGSNKSSYSSSVLVGYIYLTENNSSGESVSLKSASDKNTISENNAILWSRIDKPSNYAVTKIGIKVRSENSTYSDGWEKYEAPSKSYVGNSYMYPYYDLNDELNATLNHATKYYYRFFAIINDKEYWSDEYNFTTTGSHSYNYKGFHATHPHQCYKKCACGDSYLLDEYNKYWSECSICKSHECNYAGDFVYCWDTHPHYNCYKCTICDKINPKKTETNFVSNCSSCIEENTYAEWKKNSKGWWYDFGDGSYAKNKWEEIDGVWYHFDAKGYMQTGWLKSGNKWYYLGSSGAMVDNDWAKVGGKWYYFDADGVMQTGWEKIDNVWYYLNASGAMQTDWQKISGVWYYFNASGAMQTGWEKIGGVWYYLESNGKMLSSTSKNIGGKVYRFNASGACLNP